jgi:hypothetical protein
LRAIFAGQRGDVDDLAAAAGDHAARHRAPDQEYAGQVVADHLVPGCRRHFVNGARRWMPALLTRMSICPTSASDPCHRVDHGRLGHHIESV